MTVWCGLTASIGPHFFEDPETGIPVTVTKEHYLNKLKDWVGGKILGHGRRSMGKGVSLVREHQEKKIGLVGS